MGLSTFMLNSLLVVVASGFNYGHFAFAGWTGWPTGDSPFAAYQSPMLTQLRFGPVPIPTPLITRFPTIPTPTFLMPFPTMPTFPSVQDIANSVPKRGGTYTGVAVSTQAEAKLNGDGTVIKKGGSTIVINDDGKVTVQTSGDAPPVVGIK
ncbi:hypothetical protein HW555_001331 [Spodoptera exigua]|uniref:Uncharacterized protein n=1 Tax=Spodoptera exigua TaxID=7107 RepID=A0A835GT28_SPOEX|nr:hypothetical protein HW555_001331 [Spodoptera exigua]KAH9631515.1 hypothetical protein HF086_004676 [Spodoptera exigua]